LISKNKLMLILLIPPLLTGLPRVQLPLWKTRAAVVDAGLLLPLVVLKVLHSLLLKFFLVSLSNSSLIAALKTTVVVVVSETLLLITSRLTVWPLKLLILTRVLLVHAKFLPSNPTELLATLRSLLATASLVESNRVLLLLELMLLCFNTTLVVSSLIAVLLSTTQFSLLVTTLLMLLGKLRTLGVLIGVKMVTSDSLLLSLTTRLLTLALFALELINHSATDLLICISMFVQRKY